jgi:hypothetical protein
VKFPGLNDSSSEMGGGAKLTMRGPLQAKRSAGSIIRNRNRWTIVCQPPPHERRVSTLATVVAAMSPLGGSRAHGGPGP